MTNPFPGVDPYIEPTEFWVGFHNVLIAHCCVLLNPSLTPLGYAAVVEKRLDLVNRTVDEEALRQGDIGIIPFEGSETFGGTATAVVDVEPALLTLPRFQTIPIAYLEIRSLANRKTVTTIEVLSPSNKTTGRAAYTEKRMQLLSTGVNLVEIDLLLNGRRPTVVGDRPPGDFYAFVSRGDRRPQCEVYAWSIRRALPRLPIPLKPGENDVVLDLAAAYAMTYNGGAFRALVDYQIDLSGLSETDRAWAVDRTRAGAA